MERATLDGGATLVRQEPPSGSASFAVTVIWPGGWAYDPPGAAGIASAAAELVPNGAGDRSRAEVARELDRYGASLSSDCHPEAAEVTLWGPSDRLDRLLPLLADALAAPRFEAREVARVRRQILERQMRERTQPDRAAEKALFRALFPPGHPYRETGLGNAPSVGRLDRSALARFHHRQAIPSASVVVATCREPLGALGRRLDRAFRGWSDRPAPPLPDRRRAGAPSEAELRREVPGGSQVELRLGGVAAPRSDPAYPAAYLANEILGGRALLSRLFQELRERRGLVYHTSSQLEAMRWGGYWIAQAGAEPKKAPAVLELLKAETRRLARGPPPSAELDRIRESAIGSIWLELETTSSAHELATEVAYHDLPSDHYATWPDRLRALAPSEVMEAARTTFDLGRAVAVLAGPLARTPSEVIHP
jgi:zinc protease